MNESMIVFEGGIVSYLQKVAVDARTQIPKIRWYTISRRDLGSVHQHFVADTYSPPHTHILPNIRVIHICPRIGGNGLSEFCCIDSQTLAC